MKKKTKKKTNNFSSLPIYKKLVKWY